MTVLAKTTIKGEQLEIALALIIFSVLKLNIPASSLKEETNLYELGLDSVSIMDLLISIEHEFDVLIDVEDLSEELFSNFGRLITFVRKKVHECD